MNKTKGTVSIAEGPTAGTVTGTRSATTIWPAFGLGFGARCRITDRILLNVFYRYVSLGSVKWTPTDEDATIPLKLKGDYHFQGIGAGIQYIF